MTNDILHIKSPALDHAEAFKSEYGLDKLGIQNLNRTYWNLTPEALYEEAIFRSEGRISLKGAFIVDTGSHTARSAKDKFFVKASPSAENIDWNKGNRPIAPEKFNALYKRMLEHLKGRDVFVQDCYAGADPNYRMPVRIITELAWHSQFSRNMFIQTETLDELAKFIPEFTVMSIPSFKGIPETDGLNSETFILVNFEEKICLIGNTGYAGEIKKSIFTVLNYLLPLKGVLSMHCSANVGDKDDTALFFGLSGTGKTTLSADPTRGLIGDDEHGWSDKGVFNFEGGCYAKVINLSATAEPEIHATTEMFGTILENVSYDIKTREIDLTDDSITENTRAAYPIEFISNSLPEKMAGHPKNVIMLTCDASGVMPPIARLTPEQAMYHFISGYTSKVGGTEVGLGKEPEITFSACFGAPFMVHHPYKYAEMLKENILKHKATCWIVNTGWSGGPYGIGKRMSIKHTRALLNAALESKLDNVEYYKDPVFGFEVPKHCDNVPDEVLRPSDTWSDKKAFEEKYLNLASQFIENFKKFAEGCPQELLDVAPNKDAKLDL